jgi:Arc/MetJ-type ribon-helix-helix transcriptional regulator
LKYVPGRDSRTCEARRPRVESNQTVREGETVSKTYVETSTELLTGIDEMVKEGYYANRTEGINDAIRLLLKQYKVSKLHAKDMVLGTQNVSGKAVGGA